MYLLTSTYLAVFTHPWCVRNFCHIFTLYVKVHTLLVVPPSPILCVAPNGSSLLYTQEPLVTFLASTTHLCIKEVTFFCLTAIFTRLIVLNHVRVFQWWTLSRFHMLTWDSFYASILSGPPSSFPFSLLQPSFLIWFYVVLSLLPSSYLLSSSTHLETACPKCIEVIQVPLHPPSSLTTSTILNFFFPIVITMGSGSLGLFIRLVPLPLVNGWGPPVPLVHQHPSHFDVCFIYTWSVFGMLRFFIMYKTFFGYLWQGIWSFVDWHWCQFAFLHILWVEGEDSWLLEPFDGIFSFGQLLPDFFKHIDKHIFIIHFPWICHEPLSNLLSIISFYDVHEDEIKHLYQMCHIGVQHVKYYVWITESCWFNWYLALGTIN